MPDPNSSTRRAFYCQEALWQTFSNYAMQRGCSIDVLINEAMTAYLQSSGMQLVQAQQSPVMNQQNPMMAQQPMVSQSAYGRQPVPAAPQQNIQQQAYNRSPQPSPYAAAAPIQPAPMNVPPQGGRVPPPTPASYRRPPSIFEEDIADAPSPGGKPMVLASLSAQPPAPAVISQPQQHYGQMPQQAFGQPPLFIIFANQRYAVDKDKYIIGRSSQLADLVIRDGNISRKHCAVIFKNGAYYIKDLDSTNGIEFQGQRIDTKRIDEGDQFNICEFQFTFTYR